DADPAVAGPALRALVEIAVAEKAHDLERSALEQLAKKTGDAEALVRLAAQDERDGDVARARERLARAAINAADPRAAFSALADLLERGGDLEGACRALEHYASACSERDEHEVAAKAQLRAARILNQLGRFAEAEAAVHLAMGILGKPADALAVL